MTRPSDLTPEERDLAARLARVGGADGPSPALDAAILAAARAAAASPDPGAAPSGAGGNVVPMRRAAPKWPLGFGLAASLVLAAGIGWKVGTSEHGTAAPLAAEEADAAAADAAAAAADEPMEAVMLPPRDDPSPPPPPPLEMPAPQRQASAEGVDASAIAQGALAAPEARPMAPDEAAAPAVAREAMAAPVAAPPPPPAPMAPASPPPPSAAAKASAESEASNELDRVTVSGSRVRREGAAGTAPAVDAAQDAEFDDAPPVSADSPEVREAWLKRIRALNAAGKADEARASLREFMRRHPEVELPEDLRKLAATLPAD